MITVRDLVSRSTPSLSPSDTVERALGIMLDCSVSHLPVVDETGQLVGIVSEDQLLEAPDSEAPLRPLLGRHPVSARADEHVFDVTKVMVKHDLTMVPVTEKGGEYVGLVKRYDIFDQFARMLSTQEAGAILALEVEQRDYALSKLIHAAEQSSVKVLSAAAEPPRTEGGPFHVTMKLNTTDAARVRHMLEHEGYSVVASFGEDEDELLERVQEFMRYLEV